MALINWTEAFSVNIAEIDKQHQCLIELVNQLHEAMKTGKGNDVIGLVLSDLLSYTTFHFGTEEKYFQQYEYPESFRHKMEHDQLRRQAKKLHSDYSEGKITITIEVLNFLKDWLNTHILQSDKKYAPFLNSKGLS